MTDRPSEPRRQRPLGMPRTHENACFYLAECQEKHQGAALPDPFRE